MQSDVDHRLGWRWLVPNDIGAAVVVLGFDDVETELLKDSCARASQTEPSSEGGLIVMNVDNRSLSYQEFERQIQSAGTVVMVGRRSQLSLWSGCLRAFSDIRDYALLPTANPRLVVPLSRGNWTRIALALHRPGRLGARIALALARSLTRLGSAGVLFQHRLRIARREVQNDSLASRDFALYLGTPDDNRKTIVLPLGERAQDHIVKIGQTAAARASLAREAKALRMLGQTDLAHRVPRLFDFLEDARESVLRMEYRPRRGAGEARVRDAVLTFLADLGAVGTTEILLSDWLEQEGLLRSLGNCPRLDACIDRLIAKSATLRLQRIHGDFAPWNFAWTEAGFFVFDWEASKSSALAFSDAFYYVIAPAILIRRRSCPKKLLSATLDFAGLVAKRISVPESLLPLYLAVWLLQRNAERPDRILESLLNEATSVLCRSSCEGS